VTDNDRSTEIKSISDKARRMQQARERRRVSPWYGLGMFGLIGWAVAVPMLAGVALGLWIDGQRPGGSSWVLISLIAGAVLGALNAWYWVQREGRDD